MQTTNNPWDIYRHITTLCSVVIWKLSEFLNCLQSGCYCSPSNLHVPSRLTMRYQEHWGDVGKARRTQRGCSMMQFMKMPVFPNSILLWLVTSSCCINCCRLKGGALTHEGRQVPIKLDLISWFLFVHVYVCLSERFLLGDLCWVVGFP